MIFRYIGSVVRETLTEYQYEICIIQYTSGTFLFYNQILKPMSLLQPDKVQRMILHTFYRCRNRVSSINHIHRRKLWNVITYPCSNLGKNVYTKQTQGCLSFIVIFFDFPFISDHLFVSVEVRTFRKNCVTTMTLASVGHEQYWLCRVNTFSSSTTKDFNHTYICSVEKRRACKTIWFLKQL